MCFQPQPLPLVSAVRYCADFCSELYKVWILVVKVELDIHISGPISSLNAVLVKRWSKPSELTLAMTLVTSGYGLGTAFVAFFDGATLANGIGWIKLYMMHGCIGMI